MIKCVNFPEKYSYIKSVEVNDITYINNCHTDAPTKEIIIPFSEIQLALPTSPG